MFRKTVQHRHHAQILLIELILCCFAAPGTAAWASGPEPETAPAAAAHRGSSRDLADLSIEDLMNIEITSTARKPVRLSDATSAIFVITAEDIRRSGAQAVPEVLRMVPGLEVARISANQWAVSARGFNGRFANKLLVLIDGRSVYTPSFSGVYWEVQDLMLEDVQRIEVVRGPGAALWGANAVNGVINIITKTAKSTQGGLATVSAGTEERESLAVRYGGAAGDNVRYRVYTKHFERDGSVSPAGRSYADDGEMVRGGFRLDWTASAKDSVTLQGDAYSGIVGQVLSLPDVTTAPYAILVEDQPRVSGGNVLARWQRAISSSSEFKLQFYHDRTDRREVTYQERHDTTDLEFDHRFRLGKRQEIVWGMGYRFIADHIRGTYYVSTSPEHRREEIVSAFLQDEITAITDRLTFTLGTKVEHNEYTGYEVQPSARMLWTPGERHSIWSAASRAVRTPSRIDQDGLANTYVYPTLPLPTLIRINGNPDFKSEELLAYEAGYRFQPVETLFLDLAAFYNIYDNLRSGEPGTPFADGPPPHLVLPFTTDNKLNARVYGFELAAEWRVKPWWSLNGAYTFLEMDLYRDEGGQDDLLLHAGGQSPRHQASLRSSLNVTKNVEFDAWLRYVDELPYLAVKQYLNLDLRLGWKARKDLELVLAGQNLLDDRRQEFAREIFTVPAEIQRSVYARLVWTF